MNDNTIILFGGMDLDNIITKVGELSCRGFCSVTLINGKTYSVHNSCVKLFHELTEWDKEKFLKNYKEE